MRRSLRMARTLGNWVVLLTVVAGVGGWLCLMAGPPLAGWQSAVVLSGSMEPALKVGDIAFVERLSDGEEVRAGDVITFRSPNDPGAQVSHRVVEVINAGGRVDFRTQGDANQQPDPQLIPAENLVGEVRFRLPYVGYVVDWLRSREGFILFVGIPGVLIIAGELRSIIREVVRARRVRLRARAGGAGED